MHPPGAIGGLGHGGGAGLKPWHTFEVKFETIDAICAHNANARFGQKYSPIEYNGKNPIRTWISLTHTIVSFSQSLRSRWAPSRPCVCVCACVTVNEYFQWWNARYVRVWTHTHTHTRAYSETGKKLSFWTCKKINSEHSDRWVFSCLYERTHTNASAIIVCSEICMCSGSFKGANRIGNCTNTHTTNPHHTGAAAAVASPPRRPRFHYSFAWRVEHLHTNMAPKCCPLCSNELFFRRISINKNRAGRRQTIRSTRQYYD